jgi:hypothetical protein
MMRDKDCGIRNSSVAAFQAAVCTIYVPRAAGEAPLPWAKFSQAVGLKTKTTKSGPSINILDVHRYS